MRRRLAAVALPLLLAAGGAPPRADAAAPAAATGLPRVAIVLLPGLDWPELRDALAAGRLPHLRRLAREGAIGLLNTVTGGRPVPADAYLSLGTGAHAAGGEAAGEAYDRGETVGGMPATAVYSLRTGRPAPPGAVLHLGIASLRRAAAALPQRVAVGVLGEALARAGVPTAVLGNADVFSAPPSAGADAAAPGPGRWAATVLMDAAGAVAGGSVGADMLRADPSFPGGLRSDGRALAIAASALLARGGVVAIETGDLWRVQAEEQRLAPAAYAAARRAALERADRLLGALLPLLRPDRDALVVLSPFPSEAGRREGAWLTPVLAWGAGIRPGLLVSGTTRRPGVVANLDLAPSVLAVYGLPTPPALYGRPWRGSAAPAPLAAVDTLYRRTLANHLRRPPLIKAYIGLEVGVLLAALAAVLLRLPWHGWLRRLLVAVTCVPLAYLLLGALPPLSPWWSAAAAATFTVLLAALAMRAGGRDRIAPFAVAAALTALAVALDGYAGSRLMENSPLGHSLVGGARFYGVGNEYMGVLLGASLVAGGAALDPPRHRPLRLAVVCGAWAATLFLLASPAQGANFGGALAAAAVAYAVGLARLRAGRLTARHLAAAAAFALLVVAVAAAADGTRAVAAQSHAGRAVAALRAGDWQSLRDMVARKAALNWKLLRWTRWSLAFLLSLAMYAWLVLRPPAALAAALARRPGLAAALAANATGSLAAFAFNDSGVVAAATSLVYASALLIVAVLPQENQAK